MYEYSVAILQDINLNTNLDIGTLSAYLEMITMNKKDEKQIKNYIED